MSEYRKCVYFLVGIVFVALIAIIFRLNGIDKEALWTDEAWTIVLSLWTPWELFTQPTDTTPPLYYFLHQQLFDAHDRASVMRLLPAVCGILSVIVMTLLCRTFFGRRTGLFAGLLLAVFTAHVDYSIEARAYSLLFLLILIMVFGFALFWQPDDGVGGLRRDGGRWQRSFGLVVFALGGVASFYCHLLAAIPIGFFCLAMIFLSLKEDRHVKAQVFISLCIMALFSVPGCLWAYKLFAAEHNFTWLTQANVAVFITTMIEIYYPIGLWDNPLTLKAGLLETSRSVVFVMISCTLVIWIYVRQTELPKLVAGNTAAGLVMASAAVTPVVIWGIGFVAAPVFIGRVVLFAIPGFIVFLAMLVTPLSEKRNAVFAGFLVLIYAASTFAFGYAREKQDWRGAVRFLSQNVQSNDYIVLCPSFNYPSLSHVADTGLGSGVLLAAQTWPPVLANGPLGAEPDWDQSYFNTFEKKERRTRGVITIPPETVFWRVDGHCHPNRTHLQNQNRFFSGLGDGELLWEDRSKHSGYRFITIRRYKIETPLSLEVEFMSRV